MLAELDEADEMCPSCGGHLEPWEGQFETSEMIDVVEVSYRLVQVKQQKYVCRCGGCVETAPAPAPAPGPARAAAGGRYSLDFAVKVAIDKYLDHLPLERQMRIMDRHGLDVTSQTLWAQLYALAKWVWASYLALFTHLGRQPVIGLDQTSWKRLSGKKATPWQMWCLTSPGVVYHRICDDKSAETFKALVVAHAHLRRQERRDVQGPRSRPRGSRTLPCALTADEVAVARPSRRRARHALRRREAGTRASRMMSCSPACRLPEVDE